MDEVTFRLYLGRQFKIVAQQVRKGERAESETVFIGELDIGPDSRPLKDNIIPVIFGRPGTERDNHLAGLVPGKEYNVVVNTADPDKGYLYVDFQKKSLQELKRSIGDVLTLARQAKTLEELGNVTANIRDELINHPGDKVTAQKYLRSLADTETEALRLFTKMSDERLRYVRWENDLCIEKGKRDYLEKMSTLLKRFRGATTRETINYKANLFSLERLIDYTLIGKLDGKIVAMAGWDDTKDVVVPGHTHLWTMGLETVDPTLGKMFLEKTFPHLPFPNICISLGDYTKQDFFKNMGFVLHSNDADIVRRGTKGRADVYREYVFRPK